MQVALNDESEYEGGRLVFATAAGFEQPPRPAATLAVQVRLHVDEEVVLPLGLLGCTRHVPRSFLLTRSQK